MGQTPCGNGTSLAVMVEERTGGWLRRGLLPSVGWEGLQRRSGLLGREVWLGGMGGFGVGRAWD